VLALHPLHAYSPPCVHRDLKLENLLFGPDENLRLCDFGSCVVGPTPLRNAEDRATAEEIILKETTQMYRAPEMIDLYMREELTEKTDIWALGCIFYALCFLSHPFQDAGSLVVVTDFICVLIVTELLPKGILGAKVNIPKSASHIPEDAKTILLRMLDVLAFHFLYLYFTHAFDALRSIPRRGRRCSRSSSLCAPWRKVRRRRRFPSPKRRSRKSRGGKMPKCTQILGKFFVFM